MSIVLAFGTFDLLHPGHEFYLMQAKAQASKLIVIVARDSTVKKIKGFLPNNNEQDRLHKLKMLPYVDCAMLGHEGDKLKIIEELRPDYICLGYDQTSFTDELQEKLAERGLHPTIIRIKSFKPEIYKSSLLRKALQQSS